METQNPAPDLNPSEVQACVELLRKILNNRACLGTIPQELRKDLLMAAGRVSRPERIEISKLAKIYRRTKRKKEKGKDREATAATAIREARKNAVFTPPPLSLPNPEIERPKLNYPRACYVCKTEFSTLHFFYDAMCTPCGDLNYQKRFQTASLDGRVAFITGARLKIGYQAALMMLRAGAKVIATTRFPHDAALRFSKEEDYGQWSNRLEIHGLDLRHSPSVEHFTEYLNQTLGRLDIIINNAAQTVRRPPGFYRHLLEWESKPFLELPEGIRQTLRSHEDWKRPAIAEKNEDLLKTEWVTELAMKGAAIGLRVPALLSQIPYDAQDLSSAFFPEGSRDADLQQVDLRATNSWRMKLAEVPTPELIEVQLVNAIAPFILCSKLKPLMLRVPTHDKHIVNVSAMEGKFSRYTKTDKHPHTNMAKASLNMMTWTSAPDYAKDGIFMNAVDTGWVTDEDPALLSQRKQEVHDFQPPLDIVDGAARVCDPFFSGLITGEHVWGKFLKDYSPTTW
jgi:NAD(P)-dependent dehydrogenase (short-subunit alcohol dehydrogenase family)